MINDVSLFADMVIETPETEGIKYAGSKMKLLPFILQLVKRTNAKTILDPFMGSGTTAISAINFRRNYIGIDSSPDYCEMAEKRIKKHKSQMQLL